LSPKPIIGYARARNCRTTACRATGATSDALARPRPPSLIGKVVCTHAAAETGVPTTVFHVDLLVTVIPSAKAAVWRSGAVRKAYCTFAGPRHFRMSACATCVSAKPPNAEQVCANFAPNLPKWASTAES